MGVLESRATTVGEVQAIHRRRECERCSDRLTTYEVVLSASLLSELRKAKKVAALKNKIFDIQTGKQK